MTIPTTLSPSNIRTLTAWAIAWQRALARKGVL
jgi:hypothetical protein